MVFIKCSGVPQPKVHEISTLNGKIVLLLNCVEKWKPKIYWRSLTALEVRQTLCLRINLEENATYPSELIRNISERLRQLVMHRWKKSVILGVS